MPSVSLIIPTGKCIFSKHFLWWPLIAFHDHKTKPAFMFHCKHPLIEIGFCILFLQYPFTKMFWCVFIHCNSRAKKFVRNRQGAAHGRMYQIRFWIKLIFQFLFGTIRIPLFCIITMYKKCKFSNIMLKVFFFDGIFRIHSKHIHLQMSGKRLMAAQTIPISPIIPITKKSDRRFLPFSHRKGLIHLISHLIVLFSICHMQNHIGQDYSLRMPFFHPVYPLLHPLCPGLCRFCTIIKIQPCKRFRCNLCIQT